MSVTLIPRALIRGARLVVNWRVDRLIFQGRRATSVVATATDVHGRRHRVAVTASQVFLCAGTTQTPSILQRSGVRKSEFNEINVEGTKTVVRKAGMAGVRRVIVMSSNSPIGASRNLFEIFDEESPYHPYMGYGRSKQAMEEWLRAGASDKSLPPITIIRAPWFYGPEQPVRQTRFFSMIKTGHFPIVGDGYNRRSMGYVDSLAYGILLAADAPQAAGKIYWLADERPYPMKEIVDTVRDVLRADFGTQTVRSAARLEKCLIRGRWIRVLGLLDVRQG